MSNSERDRIVALKIAATISSTTGLSLEEISALSEKDIEKYIRVIIVMSGSYKNN